MIPIDLEILSPRTLNEALELKEQYRSDSLLIAGGTDVLVQIRKGSLQPPRLLNILNLRRELGAIKEEPDEIHVGALATISEIESSPLIQTYAPTLSCGAAFLGSPQIRNWATIGGNVCNASPAGDTITPLFVHEAEAVIISKGRTRSIPIHELFAGPLEIAIDPHEIVSHFQIPKETQFKWFLQRLSQRKALALNKVSVAGVLWLDGPKVREPRLAFSAVSPVVRRASKTENFLQDQELNRPSIEKAAKIICSEVEPITDLRSTKEYRRSMTGQLLKKGLRELQQKMKEEQFV
ncbi:MAG: FAD binding domain-containing protein [Candidatus Heimdallarchaeota archaeon]